MAKRQLNRNRIPANQVARKLVIRLVKDGDVSNPAIASPINNVAGVSTADPPIAASQPIWRYRRFGRWSLLWLSIGLILGGTGLVGVLWLTTVPPAPDCRHGSSMLSDSERLYCAQLSAQSGKLDNILAAMKVVENWPQTHPLYLEAQRMMGRLSQDLLNIARQKINQGDLQQAVAIAGKVPASSPLYSQAQDAIASWQQEWQQGEDLTQKFQEALKTQNWQQAWQQIEAMLRLNFKFWNSSTQEKLMQQLAAEKQGWQQLQEAEDIAQSNNPEDLEQAIALASKINPKTYINAQAKDQKNKWSRALLQVASKLYGSQDFDGAIVIAKTVPADVSAYSEAQDWLRLSHASQLAVSQNPLALLEALSLVRQIAKPSPLYQQASDQKSLWKNHLKDELQLQVASAIASLDQPLMLQLAIDQAQMVAPSHPRRIEAQTLIASWRKEMQGIEDRSALARAQILAKPGTIESLKEAIAQASQIALGQSLRIDAQTAIAHWNQQIQVIEDRPILDLAKAFAQKGDLNSAVDTAQKIRPGRALSQEAQADVDNWVSQIQIAQDRPLLDAANALAAQGRLDAAMMTASQVRAGRPLYNEAQAAIDRWQSQLAPVVPPPATSSEENSANSSAPPPTR